MRHVTLVVRRRPRHAKQLKRPARKTYEPHTQQHQTERPSSTAKQTGSARQPAQQNRQAMHDTIKSINPKDIAATGRQHCGTNVRYTRGLRDAMVVQHACSNRARPKERYRARQHYAPNATVGDDRPSPLLRLSSAPPPPFLPRNQERPTLH